MNAKEIVLMTVLGLGILPLASAESADQGWTLFGAVDYFAPTGVDDDIKDDLDAVLNALGNASGTTDTTGGIGIRAGLRKPVADGKFDIGGSLGYIFGPNIDAKLIDNTTPPGTLETEISASYVRLLGEAAGRLRITDSTYFRLGIGAGIARAHVKQETTGTGFYAGSATGNESEIGFTWEISPSFVVTREKVGFEAGVRLAGMPKLKETNTTDEIEWTPFGVFASLLF